MASIMKNRSKVVSKIIKSLTICLYNNNYGINGHFSNSSRAQVHLCHMTSMIRACLVFWVESYVRSDICCYSAMTLSPFSLVVNWPVFTICNILLYFVWNFVFTGRGWWWHQRKRCIWVVKWWSWCCRQ